MGRCLGAVAPLSPASPSGDGSGARVAVKAMEQTQAEEVFMEREISRLGSITLNEVTAPGRRMLDEGGR